MTSVSTLREVSNDECVYPHCTAHLVGRYPTKPAHIVGASFFVVDSGYIRLPHRFTVLGKSYAVNSPGSGQRYAVIRAFKNMPNKGDTRVAVLDFPGDEGLVNMEPWTALVAMHLGGLWKPAVGVRAQLAAEVEF